MTLLQPGEYQVEVTAWTPVDSDARTLTVHMVGVSSGLRLTPPADDSQGGSSVTMELAMDELVGEFCILVDYGDGTNRAYEFPTGACSAYTDVEAVTLTSPTTPLTHEYQDDGRYTVTVESFNSFQNETLHVDVTVSTADCRDPYVIIENVAPDFRYPTKVQKSKTTHVYGSDDLDCSLLDNRKQWVIVEVNPADGSVISVIDTSSLDTTNKRELVLPKHFLPYGLYKLTFTVTMTFHTNPELATRYAGQFVGSAITYIQVGKSDLIVRIVDGGMSYMTVGGDTDLELEPEMHSLDPDEVRDGTVACIFFSQILHSGLLWHSSFQTK